MSDKLETSPLNLKVLQEAVSSSAAAFRCRRQLQPAGGEGDKVFPPTFAGAVYAVEQRRVPGREQPATCVLLDSVQSQANRMELALQDALEAGRIMIPVIEVDFTDYGPTGDLDADMSNGRLIDAVGKVTSLQVPHRLADAILRDSQIGGVDFRRSETGKALNTVSLANATPIFRLCPTALVFGMWDSTGPKGGLGPKFERALVSEVVGIGAEVGDLLRGVRRDPFEASNKVPILKASPLDWKVADDPKAKGVVKPSAVNHSSVPYPKQRDKKTEENNYSGVTIDYAEQMTTLSLICLRRLRFPINGILTPSVDAAARSVLAALGLCAATLAFESGLGLRSRCLLWPDAEMQWELLERPGATPNRFSLNADQSVQLLRESVVVARDAGLPWMEEPIRLKPSPELLKLVRLSQVEATKEGADGGA
jgi:CRISPR-associated protein Csb1